MILANATHSADHQRARSSKGSWKILAADQVIGRLDRWGTGGGAGSIKEQLHPAPLTVAGNIPVLCLDSWYSRHPNREGLYLMASALQRAATTKKRSSRRNDSVVV